MSLFARGWLASILVLGVGATALADEPQLPTDLLDLLPATELGSFGIRDVARLERDGDALIDAVGVPMNYRPSRLTEFAVHWLGLKDEYDAAAPLACIVTKEAVKLELFRGCVLAVPFRSRESIAEWAQLDPQSNAPVHIPRLANEVGFISHGAIGKKHLLLASDDRDQVATRAIRSVLSSPPLAKDLPAASLEAINENDLWVHIAAANIRAADPDWSDFDLRLAEQKLDADEVVVAKSIEAALREARHAFFGIRVEDGIALQSRFQFAAAEDAVSRRLLQDLRGSSPAEDAAMRSMTLHGLPAGPVLAAGATRLTQPRQQLLLRTLTQLLASDPNLWNWASSSGWHGGRLTDLRQAIVLGALGEVLPLSNEVRFGIYPIGEGHVSTVVILECDDPTRTVAAIRELSDLFVDSSADAPAARPPIDAAESRRLLAELTAENLATRQRAATRILIQGDKSLGWLDDAAKSDDPETARRVKLLMEKLHSSTQQRTERLLSDNPLVSAHPRLTYHAAAESAAGQSVDVIHIELAQAEAGHAEALAEMFGPGWDRVRVVRLPRHVVVTIGSPGPWLPAAIDNLQHNRPGLAHDPRLVNLADDPNRLLELHVPISRFVPEAEHKFFSAGEPKNMSPSVGLTAIGLSATDDEFWLDVHFPVEEVRGMVVKRGWSW